MAHIKLDNLAHSYYDNPKAPSDYALKQVDYVWEDGGAYALLGPSGCGKTTLLNIISGLLVPSKGQIVFDDQDVTHLTPEQRNIAQVFQFPVIYDTMSVAQNLAFPLVNRGVDKSEIDKRVKDMLVTLELTEKANRRAQGLTADEKQKISLGRGLVRYDVNAILFDEPLTVIDPHMKWQLRTKLKELHLEFGHTMIYVTHDQTEALTFADKVVVMYDGDVVQIGTPEELFEEPEHTFVGYFIGSPGMNVIPGAVEGNIALVGGQKITLPRAYPTLQADLEIGIRPEFVHITDKEHAGSEGLPIKIGAVENIGRELIVRGEISGLPVNAILPEGASIPTEAFAVFEPDKVKIFHNSYLLKGDS